MTTAVIASVQDDAMWIILVCTVILGVGLLLCLGIWLYGRRWLRSGDQPTGGDETWSLEDLERLREGGDLTEEEYAVMRATLVAAYKGESPPPRSIPPLPVPELEEDGKKEGWDWVNPDFDLKKPPEG